MLEKLKGIKERYEQLTALLSDPAVIGDQNRYRELSKEQAGLTDIVNAYDEYMAADAEIESCKAMLEEADDAAMREMIHEELNGLSAKEQELSERLKVMLLPKDPNDDRDVIIEVRAGTGGEEAALFGADLLRMYTQAAMNAVAAASGSTMPTTTGMNAPAAIRKMLQHTPQATGLLILRQRLPPTVRSIRNAPSAVIRWQPKPFRQPAAVSILTATAASGSTMPTTTGMNALAEIRPIRRSTTSSGLLTRKRPQRKMAPSMKNARFAAARRRQLRFQLPEHRLSRASRLIRILRRPVTTAICSSGSHCCLSAAVL